MACAPGVAQRAASRLRSAIPVIAALVIAVTDETAVVTVTVPGPEIEPTVAINIVS